MTDAGNLSVVFRAWPKGWVDETCFGLEPLPRRMGVILQCLQRRVRGGVMQK